MSSYNDIDITCEQCTDEFKGSVWTAVHAGEDPELKELLVGGELNLVMCPHCSHVAFHEQFLLYTDPEAELVAYVYPKSQEAEADFLRPMMLTSFAQAQAGVEPEDRSRTDAPTLLFGLETLAELLREEEEREEQSEVARAIGKEHRLAITSIPRSRARALTIPYLLPLSQADAKTRESLIAGLTDLLKINDALSLYKILSDRLQADFAFNPL